MKEMTAIDLPALSEGITEDAQAFDRPCAVSLFSREQRLGRVIHGTKDCPLTAESTFVLDGADGLLLGLTAYILFERGIISPDDRAARLLPEAADLLPDTLTVGGLMRRRSRLADPLCGGLLPKASAGMKDPADAICAEALAFAKSRSFSRLSELFAEGDFSPADPFVPGSAEPILLAEILRRAAGGSLLDFQRESIFAPLGIENRAGAFANTRGFLALAECERVECPLEGEFEGVYTVGIDGLERLCAAVSGGGLLRRETWQTALSPRGGVIPFCGRGFVRGFSSFGGWEIVIRLRPSDGTAMLIASCEQPRAKRDGDGVFRGFEETALGRLEGQLIRPRRTRMEPLNARTLPELVRLGANEGQAGYTAAPPTAALEAITSGGEVFLATEGGTAVGMVAVSGVTDGEGCISSLLVDRRFQGRGFGRMICRWALRRLSEQGARRVFVAVDRRNAAAQALYGSLGFVVGAVYASGVVMYLDAAESPRPKESKT